MGNSSKYTVIFRLYSMVKVCIIITICFISALNTVQAQETVNQKGRVREITYSIQEEITPIGNVFVKLRNGITATSHRDGLFLLPVNKSSFFYIENIEPQSKSKYSLITPSRVELNKPFRYSSNLFDIVFINDTRQKREVDRLVKNRLEYLYKEQKSLERQIADLTKRLEKAKYESETITQKLIQERDSLIRVNNQITKEFNIAKIQKEVEQLVSIDYATLTPEDAQKIDLKKEGDWSTLQKLVRKDTKSDFQMKCMVQDYERFEAKTSALLDSTAQKKAALNKAIQAYRDMYESYANMHNRDSAIYYINKLFLYPKYVTENDYITCSNYVFGQTDDSKKAKGIIEIGINRYIETKDLDSEIKLLLNLAEIEYQSGKVHEAYKIFNDVEEKLVQLDSSHIQTQWYAKNKIGAFYVSIGEIKKGIELMEFCNATFQDIDISDLDKYEFLSNYAFSLTSIGRYNDAEKTVEYLLSELKPLTSNITYNEMYAENICNKANIQSAQGLINKAVDNYNIALTTYKDIFGKSSKAEVPPRMKIADFQFSIGKFDEAFESLDTIIGIINSSYDDPEIPLIQIQLKRAEFLFDLARFEDSERIYQDQIKILDKHYANQPINATDAYLGLAKIYKERGEYQRALKILLDCDSLVQQTFPQDGLFKVSILSGIANVKFATELYQEAINLLERAKSITQDMIGTQSLIYENICVELASYKRQMGFYDEAKSLLSDVQTSRQSLPLEIKRMPCSFKLEEINLLSDLGDYEQMKSKIDTVLKEAIPIYGENHPVTINLKSQLAAYYVQIGELDKAVNIYNDCIELTQKYFPEIDILVSSYYQTLSNLYSFVGDIDNARFCADKVYDTYNKTFGDESIKTIQAKLNSLSINSDKYEYISKINTLDTIIDALTKHVGTNSTIRNNVMLQKANLLNENGHYHEALNIFNDILNVNTATFGYRHQNNLGILCGMAQCYTSLLNYKEASRLYKETVAIASEIYGERNVYYNQVVMGYCDFLINTGQYSKALRLAEDTYKATDQTNSKLAQISTMLCLSSIYVGQEDYNKALSCLDTALELHLAIYKKDNYRTIPIYRQYAQLYSNCLAFGKAMDYYEKANHLANLFYSENDDIILDITLSKINILIESYKTSEARTLADGILTKLSCIPNGSIRIDKKILATYNTIAYIYQSIGDSKKAIDILNTLYQHLVKTPGSEMAAAQIIYSIADNECNLMDYNSALDNIIIAENMALALDSPALLRNIKVGHAKILASLGRFDEAYEILKDYSIEILNVPDNINNSYITICDALYSLFSVKQDKKNAIRFKEILKEYYRKSMGENSPHYIGIEFRSIINGESMMSYADNLVRISMLLNTIDSICGTESRISKDLHFQAALYQYCQEGSIISDRNLKKCFESFSDVLEGQPNTLAEVYLHIAQAYQTFGRIEESREFLKRSKNIIDSVPDKNSYLYNEVKLPYMQCMISIGDFNEAESSLKECKEYIHSIYGKNSPALLTLLQNEISLCFARLERSAVNNDLERAEKVINEFENIINISGIDFPMWESQINYNKGLLYNHRGMPTLANIYFDKYKEYILEHYGDNSPHLYVYYIFQANKIFTEAFNNRDNIKLSEIEMLTNKALNISEEFFEPDSPIKINIYKLQADTQIFKYSLSQDISHLDEALTLLDKCLTITDHNCGDSPIKYQILASKLQVYFSYNDLDNAENVLDKQYDLAVKIWGKESYNAISIKCGYAYLSMMKKLYDDAAKIYNEVLEFLYKHDSYEAEKINIHNMYAIALSYLEKYEEAKTQLGKALKLIENSNNPDQYKNIKSNILNSLNSL